MSRQEFEATVQSGDRGRVYITIPFDPTVVWGKKQRYYVQGTLNNCSFRSSLGSRQGSYFMPLNKDLQQRANLTVGAIVRLVMEPDEPEQNEVPADLNQILANEPEASHFFEQLTVFYRNQYLQWIAEAKTPITREKRIQETLAALKAKKKQR